MKSISELGAAMPEYVVLFSLIALVAFPAVNELPENQMKTMCQASSALQAGGAAKRYDPASPSGTAYMFSFTKGSKVSLCLSGTWTEGAFVKNPTLWSTW